MRENCLNEGTIQAFLDGELNLEARDTVSQHLALCDDCLLLLSEAEEEAAVAFSALEQEFNTLVPTHRLWSKINTSIEEERRSQSFWNRIMAGLSSFGFQLSLTPVAAFGSLVIVAGLFAAIYLSPQMPSGSEVAIKEDFTNRIEIAPPVVPQNVVNSGKESEDVIPNDDVKVAQTISKPKNLQPEAPRNLAVKTVYSAPGRIQRPEVEDQNPNNAVATAYLPGEESYIKTIATLKETVDLQKDVALKPSERFVFEKDMAVIDDSIRRMKKEVEKNPNNRAARRVLLASYQNKVDLLNSVSEKTELMASLR
ncbi:MAG TPA: zf-HC2 domain-containing protein [Pyrinomonadaceae bacterium]|nr:zf-HC2 domain-containing protein [Pyrinomonadaceae bacterium]